jgi:uridine phosphorylase
MGTRNADRPLAGNGRQYHLETGPDDLAERCLLVGAPERAKMIAKRFFAKRRKVGDHRGLRSYTGEFAGVPVSVVTTGMGGASAGIVLPEAVASGASVFVRVGSCGALVRGARPGDVAIATGAVRFDGASDNWAPVEWPAVADHRLVGALVASAKRVGAAAHVGIGVTTSCFREGQARPDDDGWLAARHVRRHEELVKRGAVFYSMEDAAIFVWCSTHGGLPAAAVNAVYANRVTGAFDPVGDETAAEIALMALALFK